VQLSEFAPRLSALGITIVTVTYDSHEDAKTFHDRNHLLFPILMDEASELIQSLGILNTGPQPGDAAYGIPYPGMFLVDKAGKVSAKFAEAGYRDRPNYNAILRAAAKLAK
jgi:peroxiredoxin